MAIPKDLDSVGLFIYANDRPVFSHVEQVFAPGYVHLPATIAVVAPRDESRAVAHVRLVGFTKGKARIIRDAAVGIPASRRALFRFPLYFLSFGSGSGDQPTSDQLAEIQPTRFEPLQDFVVPCGGSATSADRGGVCGSMDFSSLESEALLPDYVAADVFGAGAEPPVENESAKPEDLVSPDGLCFPVNLAFAKSRVIDIPADSIDCSIDTGVVYKNIGLLTKDSGEVTAAGEHIVPLDSDATDALGEIGFRYEGTKLFLPKAACIKKGTATPEGERVLDILGSNVDFASKSKRVPVCTRGSATVNALKPGQVVTPASDGGPPPPDASVVDARVDASVDSGPPPPPPIVDVADLGGYIYNIGLGQGTDVYAFQNGPKIVSILGGVVRTLGDAGNGKGPIGSAVLRVPGGYRAVAGRPEPDAGSGSIRFAVDSVAPGASIATSSVSANTSTQYLYGLVAHNGTMFVAGGYASGLPYPFYLTPMDSNAAFGSGDSEHQRGLASGSTWLSQAGDALATSIATSTNEGLFVVATNGTIELCPGACIKASMSLRGDPRPVLGAGTILSVASAAQRIYFQYKGATAGSLARLDIGNTIPVVLDGAIDLTNDAIGVPDTGVATDGYYVYYASKYGGAHALFAIPVQGGARKTIATSPNAITAIQVGVTDVVWADAKGLIKKRRLEE